MTAQNPSVTEANCKAGYESKLWKQNFWEEGTEMQKQRDGCYCMEEIQVKNRSWTRLKKKEKSE